MVRVRAVSAADVPMLVAATLRRLCLLLWNGPGDLPRSPKVEWRTSVGRWLGLGFVMLALMLGLVGGFASPLYAILCGVLLLVVVLTRFLYQEMQRARAALADRLQQAHVLNGALEHQTLHDLLTDLPNRTLFQRRARQAIEALPPGGRESIALLLIDLDRFKDINYTFGHKYGDLLLQQIGPRLSAAAGPASTVARLGGDEFGVLVPGVEAIDAERVARRLLNSLDDSFRLPDHTVEISGSVGIALSPQHGADADTLLQRADVAMYVAKQGNRGFAMYAPELDQHNPDRLALVGDLRRAIERNELHLVYQPKVDLKTGRCVGAEALVRWHHPQLGLILPDRFVPLAEQTGLIKALSRWVLGAAMRQLRIWQGQGRDLPIAINLSMRDLQDPDLTTLVAELLDKWSVPPSRLVVEITENGLMADPARALETIMGLRAMGIRIAIDDFGTGYSSLTYLKRLPVDELKIDRSFVRELADDEDDQAIVRSTINLGHELGLQIVAEGVEDQATWERLRQLGCDIGQGFHISRPVPPTMFLQQVTLQLAA